MGIAVGLIVASLATRFIARLLYGVTPLDATTLIVVVVILVAAAFGTAYLPARRAAAVDPMIALWYE